MNDKKTQRALAKSLGYLNEVLDNADTSCLSRFCNGPRSRPQHMSTCTNCGLAYRIRCFLRHHDKQFKKTDHGSA